MALKQKISALALILVPIVSNAQTYRDAGFDSRIIDVKKQVLENSVIKSKNESAKTYDLDGFLYSIKAKKAQSREENRGLYCNRQEIFDQIQHQFELACQFRTVMVNCMGHKERADSVFANANQVNANGTMAIKKAAVQKLNQYLTTQIDARQACYSEAKETFLTDSCQKLYEYKVNENVVQIFGEYCQEEDASQFASDVSFYIRGNIDLMGSVRDWYIKMRLNEHEVAKKIAEIERQIASESGAVNVSTNAEPIE